MPEPQEQDSNGTMPVVPPPPAESNETTQTTTEPTDSPERHAKSLSDEALAQRVEATFSPGVRNVKANLLYLIVKDFRRHHEGILRYLRDTRERFTSGSRTASREHNGGGRRGAMLSTPKPSIRPGDKMSRGARRR